MYRLDVSGYVSYLSKVIEKIRSKKDDITQLDAALGDGDHWANLMLALNQLEGQLDSLRALSFEELFKHIAKTFMSASGGSSGILYCSAYLNAATYLKGKQELVPADLPEILRLEQEGMEKRGGAKPGDKTMIDAIHGACAKADPACGDDTQLLRQISAGAYEGMQATKDMKAKKGRACYREDKGVGYIDPGALTMYYQIDCLVKEFLSQELNHEEAELLLGER